MKLQLKSGTVVSGTCVPMDEHLIRVALDVEREASALSDLQLLNDNGRVFGTYSGYDTVYRELEDGSVILSNDGSVYSEPEVPEPEVPEPYVPTLEEMKTMKQEEVHADCSKAIYAGINVNLSTGVEHFALKIEDQINLFGKQAQMMSGAELLEYHQDGCPCKYYSAEDMQKIMTEALWWVSYHTTYCNALNMWIAGAETGEELNKIYYGADVPEEYQSEVLKDYLVKIMAEAENETGSETDNETVS